MNKKERMLFALGEIDDQYIKEAESKMKSGTIITSAIAACLVLALGLYLFIPFTTAKSNVTEYKDSAYFSLIEKIDEYKASLNRPRYDNNFEMLVATVGGLFATKGGSMAPTEPTPEFDGSVMAPGVSNGDNYTSSAPDGNGQYVESTDNQVEGVIEDDIMKMTDKYIFRLSHDLLRVYTIDKEDSRQIAEYKIPRFEDEYDSNSYTRAMYLSEDGNRIIFVNTYLSNDQAMRVGIVSLDVSDLSDIKEIKRVSIDGTKNTTRLTDSKLIVISSFNFYANSVDYSNPETFVPSINAGEGDECIPPECVIYPEEITSTKYTVVTLLDVENLEVLASKALLNFTNDVYISKNSIYITNEYTEKTNNGSKTKSDVAVLSYADGTLENRVLTIDGMAEDQYSFDEKDGHLRVVTSTTERLNGQLKRNANLYVINLESGETVASVEGFAPDGEEATAVRFDGDSCYVCTAVVVTFTDPVYFFDLSDYSNITYTDTGIIEGYSDHLINYGDGFAVGIGREDWQYSKIEIYEDKGDGVKGTYKLKFEGTYSTDYKAYLVNRKEKLFGFGIKNYGEHDELYDRTTYYNCYMLVEFGEDTMLVHTYKLPDLNADFVRAAYIDGYLYITTVESLTVVAVE